MEAESLLLGVLGKDYGDGVFKFLAPRTAACLRCATDSSSACTPPGGTKTSSRVNVLSRHAAVRGARNLKTPSP